MKTTMQYLLSALTAFVIAGGGSLLAVLGSGYKPNQESWIISIVTGAMAASKDIRSLMRSPPVAVESFVKLEEENHKPESKVP